MAYLKCCCESPAVTKPAGRLQDRHPFGCSDSDMVTKQEWDANATSYIHHVVPSLYVQAILSPFCQDLSCQTCHSPLHLDECPPLEALGCWHIVTTMSACLLISLRVMFQSRYDRSNATRLNPNGSNRWGTKQQPSHIIILMTASCHEQHHMALMTNTVDL